MGISIAEKAKEITGILHGQFSLKNYLQGLKIITLLCNCIEFLKRIKTIF